MGFLRKLFLGGLTEEEAERRLISRIEIRVTPDEKVLIRNFADFRGISSSQLIRQATIKYINDVIRIED